MKRNRIVALLVLVLSWLSSTSSAELTVAITRSPATDPLYLTTNNPVEVTLTAQVSGLPTETTECQAFSNPDRNLKYEWSGNVKAPRDKATAVLVIDPDNKSPITVTCKVTAVRFSKSGYKADNCPAETQSGTIRVDARRRKLLEKSLPLSIPITQGVSQAKIKGVISIALSPVSGAQAALRAQVAAAMEAFFASLQDGNQDKSWWQQLTADAKNAVIDAAAQQAATLLAQADATVTAQIEAVKDDLASKLKSALDTAAGAAGMNLKVSGTYYYFEGRRDPGDPGWQDVKFNSGTLESVKATGSVEFQVNVGVAAGVNATIPIKVKIAADGEITLKAIDERVLFKTKPVTPVEVTPRLTVKVNGSLTMGAGTTYSGGLGAGLNIDLDAVSGELKADGNPVVEP